MQAATQTAFQIYVLDVLRDGTVVWDPEGLYGALASGALTLVELHGFERQVLMERLAIMDPWEMHYA